MLRKVCAFPFKVVIVFFGFITIMSMTANGLIGGKRLSEVNERMRLLLVGLKVVNKDEDSSIIELVEKYYGSGKAMQVSEILNRD